MTDVVVDWKREAVFGELKRLIIKTTAAADTGHLYDTNLDATDGRGREFEEITDAYHIGATGTRVDASWDASTGIVTLGTVSGGAVSVYLVIEGR
jgi:hypothetical protein